MSENAPAPVVSAEAPVPENAPAPVVSAEAPVPENVPVPVVSAEAPVSENAPAPVVSAEAPVPENVPAPVVSAEVPVSENAPAPVVSAEAPVPENVPVPVVSAEAPVPENVPVPVVSAEAPVPENVPAPVVSAEVPVPENAPAPVVSAEAPVPENVPAPVVSAEAPVPESVPVPVVSAEAPVPESLPVPVVSAEAPEGAFNSAALLTRSVESPVLTTALEEKDVIAQSADPVRQVAMLPLLTFYIVSPVKSSQVASPEASVSEKVDPGTVLQQNTFLYQMIQSSQKAYADDPGASRKRSAFVPLSWSSFVGNSNAMTPPDMLLTFPPQPTPFFAMLGRVTVGTLETPDASVALRIPEMKPLQLTRLQTGSLSSVVAEAEGVETLAQKSPSQTLSAMTFGDFLSMHEAYESIRLSPLPAPETKTVRGSELPPEASLKPSTPPLTVGRSSLMSPGLLQNPALSFSNMVSQVESLSIVSVLPRLNASPESMPGAMPPDVKAAPPTSSSGESRSALDSAGEQSSSAAPRVNLSASQVIQAINQNIPIHIADFPAFVSRVLQVQPPTVTQPQALQVTLSPDSLGKITAQFELTAQGTVNITLLSQSALTVNKLNAYLQEIQQIIGTTQFAAGQIMVRQGIPLAKQSQSFDQQSQSERDSGDDPKQIQRRGGQRRRRDADEEISIDVTV